MTLGDCISRYLKIHAEKAGVSRSTKFGLRKILDFPIAEIKPSEINFNTLRAFAEWRVQQVKPQTVGGDLSYIKKMLVICPVVFDIETDARACDDVRFLLKKKGVVSRSSIRDREMSKDEELLVVGELRVIEGRGAEIPYVDIFAFELETALRIGEICNLRQSDLNEEKRVILVRDRKNSEDSVLPLSKLALKILKKHQGPGDKFFNFNKDSVGKGFRSAFKRAGIQDLRFHDLRRTVATRLLRQGFDVGSIAAITGHKDISVLWGIYNALQAGELAELPDFVQPKS